MGSNRLRGIVRRVLDFIMVREMATGMIQSSLLDFGKKIEEMDEDDQPLESTIRHRETVTTPCVSDDEGPCLIAPVQDSEKEKNEEVTKEKNEPIPINSDSEEKIEEKSVEPDQEITKDKNEPISINSDSDEKSSTEKIEKEIDKLEKTEAENEKSPDKEKIEVAKETEELKETEKEKSVEKEENNEIVKKEEKTGELKNIEKEEETETVEKVEEPEDDEDDLPLDQALSSSKVE